MKTFFSILAVGLLALIPSACQETANTGGDTAVLHTAAASTTAPTTRSGGETGLRSVAEGDEITLLHNGSSRRNWTVSEVLPNGAFEMRGGGMTTRMSPNRALAGFSLPSGDENNYEPDRGDIRLQKLEVGQEWSAPFTFSKPGGVQQWDNHCRVIDDKPFNLNGRAFKAYTIKCALSGPRGRDISTIRFSPEIGHIVEYDADGKGYRMTAFSPGDGRVATN